MLTEIQTGEQGAAVTVIHLNWFEKLNGLQYILPGCCLLPFQPCLWLVAHCSAGCCCLQASAQIMHLLQQLYPAAILEKASIDEAYLDLTSVVVSAVLCRAVPCCAVLCLLMYQPSHLVATSLPVVGCKFVS